MSKMLSSWKEIAHFFGKGVRTVQRWEKTLDLPIRRPPGAPSNVVLARTSDLEAWMHRGPGQAAVQADENAEAVGTPEVEALLTELETEIRRVVTINGQSLPVRNAEIEKAVPVRLQQMLTDLRVAAKDVDHVEEHPLLKAA